MEPRPATDTVSILVVDDGPSNLIAFEGLLSREGRHVVKATSGNEALALMLEHDFAVVLLDVQMPGMDGFEMAELMRQSERTRHIPIIFVTAINKAMRYIFKGYESGAVDYLLKPVDPSILEAKVEVFCQLQLQRKIIERQLRTIEQKNEQLESQLAEIKTLRGFLPICCYCKNVRNDDGFWEAVEVYVSERSGLEFTHGICERCLTKQYPEVLSSREE